MCIVCVLVMAAAATRKIRASRLNALRRSLDDLAGAGTYKSRTLLGDFGLNLFARKHEWHERGFASAGRVRCKAGQPVSAID